MRNLSKLTKSQLEELLRANEQKKSELAAGIERGVPDYSKPAFERTESALDNQIDAIKAELKNR